MKLKSTTFFPHSTVEFTGERNEKMLFWGYEHRTFILAFWNILFLWKYMVSDCREDSYYFSVLERIKRKQNFYVCEHTHGRKKFREIYDAFVLLSGQYKEKFFCDLSFVRFRFRNDIWMRSARMVAFESHKV